MKLLQELHSLHEGDVPDSVNKIELADLVKHFPNNYKKAIAKLWGGPRLCWRGIPFFGESDSIIDSLDKAVSGWVKNGGEVSVHLDPVQYTDADGQEFDIELGYDEKVDPAKDGQEIYIGYDLQKDTVYVGYDGHMDEEVFNDEWDKAFHEATDENFEVDNKEHYKAFKEAHAQYQSEGNVWFLFKLDLEDGELTANEAVPAGTGLFYAKSGTSGYDKAQHLGLIDLRLD